MPNEVEEKCIRMTFFFSDKTLHIDSNDEFFSRVKFLYSIMKFRNITSD